MRRALTVVMDVLVVLSVILLAHLIVAFFGVLSGQGWVRAALAVSARLVVPFGFPVIETPYRGVFAPDAALTMFLMLAFEWLLTQVRRRV